MLQDPTVFIIGAGAGADVGMPVGDTLSAEIASKVDIRYEDGTRLVSGDDDIIDILRAMARERKEDFNLWRVAGCTIKNGIHYTRSIDSYIHAHKDNEKIKVCAKLAIVQTILEYERKSALFVEGGKTNFQRPAQVRASWLHDFLYVLQDDIVACENLDRIFGNLTIVNFNYDRCIEQFLFFALMNLYQKDQRTIAALLQSLKVFHPYGVVGKLSFQETARAVPFGATPRSNLRGLADQIRTFNEEIDEREYIAEIHKEIASAERIVFLGFISIAKIWNYLVLLQNRWVQHRWCLQLS
jgi:hypothetical protein